MKVYEVKLEGFECDVIKACSAAYTYSYRINNNTINPAPFSKIRTQEEIDKKDDYLLNLRNQRRNK